MVISLILGILISPFFDIPISNNTFIKYLLRNIIFGSVVIGSIGFLILFFTLFIHSTHHYYYNAYTSKNTHIFVAIVIVLGIYYMKNIKLYVV
jgi:hypothetical protein